VALEQSKATFFMSKLLLLLLNEHGNEHDLNLKKNYSEPKSYNADGDLTKRWYVYYSFRNPDNGQLTRQKNLYLGVNRFKNLKDRTKAVEGLRKKLLSLLENGFNPYIKESNELTNEESKVTIQEAINLVLEIKQVTYEKSSFIGFKSRVNKFGKWLFENGFENKFITDISKKNIIDYLNYVLLESSAANRNNTRSNLSVFFSALKENEIIASNLIESINVINSRPERNKTYSSSQENDIYKYMLENDQELLLFVKFISYNFLRPIEVCRLRVKDVDLIDRRLYVRAKNKPVKIKIIPELLCEELSFLNKCEKDNYIFTPEGYGQKWDTEEDNKRNYWSKRFKKIVKTEFELGEEYGMYSFRHTFISKLYREFRKELVPFEAKSKLMLITGHSTMSALEKYLRDIDAELPEDYSEHIK
jgi:integrase